MESSFGKKCGDIRRWLGIKQEYMATRLALKGQKAYSRLERGERRMSAEQQETVAGELGFSSVESFCSFDLKDAIAHHEAARRRVKGEACGTCLPEHERLVARITELENELSTLPKVSRATDGSVELGRTG